MNGCAQTTTFGYLALGQNVTLSYKEKSHPRTDSPLDFRIAG